MGILSVFKRKAKEESQLEKRLYELKNKRINCVFEDFEQLVADVRNDNTQAARLTPVNYYALKDKYIEAHYFYAADYSECYVRFTAYEKDKVIAKSEIFRIDAKILVKSFAKVGIIVNNEAVLQQN